MRHSYRLFVIDEKGRSSNVVYPDHSRNGIPCLHFSDDKPFTIVLEHESVTTYIPFDNEGTMLEIEQSEEPAGTYRPPASERKRKHRGRKVTKR